MTNKLTIIFIIFVFFGCTSNEIYQEYKSLPGYWQHDDFLQFTLPEFDSTAVYNIFLNIRSTNEYPYNNLFLICAMNFPNGKVVTDTLEYQMAHPDGTWLGTGNSIKDNKLWYREEIRFFEEGNYTLHIKQAMRNINEVEGVSKLLGIRDVGVSIEKVILKK